MLRLDRLETIWLEEKRAGEIFDAAYVGAVGVCFNQSSLLAAVHR